MCSAALLLLAMYAGASRAQGVEELDDAASRIQYAFYTADARALQNVLRMFAEAEFSADLAAMKAYYLAYGNWRLAQVQATGPTADRTASERAARDCVRHAEATIEAGVRAAEAYALQAVCEDFSPDPAEVECDSRPLRKAVSMEPENPRVLLVDAMCRNEPGARDTLRGVVETFEAQPPRTSGKPDWGHAEALTLLGASYLTRGDPVAARDALERALVIAPDYREAQELLRTAAVRPQ